MGLTDVLEHLDDKAERGKIKTRDMMAAFDGRSYGPILLGLVLIEILPTGAIPGVPTLVALMVIIIAGQLVFGRTHPWAPKKLADKGVDQSKLAAARRKLRPTTKRIDKMLKPRLGFFTSAMAARIVGIVCVALALLMPPLELIPFASSAPAAAIAVFGLGLSSKDGLIIVIGFALSVGVAIAAAYWLV